MKTIGIIALSGDVNKEQLEATINKLEVLGYKIKLSKNIYNQNRYLAGSDESKLEALCEFFQDKEIDIILAARGGYGAIRLINKIDYDIIRKNPKPFCGFSDVTALLLMIYKKTGLITYHSPMACTDFTNKFNYKHFLKALSDEKLEFTGTKIYKDGCAEGIIWGGNLATVTSLCGVDFIPDRDFIFFAEDLNEPVYKIDKMFTQLFNIEKFRNRCKGIVLGDFLEIDNEEWLEELFKTFPTPTVGGFKITHAQEKLTIPIGKNARLENKCLIV